VEGYAAEEGEAWGILEGLGNTTRGGGEP
jgi:hypothetical protein